MNDIMSNMCAIITAVLAGFVPNGWWIDPVGAVAISLYIVVRWLAIAKQQVSMLHNLSNLLKVVTSVPGITAVGNPSMVYGVALLCVSHTM